MTFPEGTEDQGPDGELDSDPVIGHEREAGHEGGPDSSDVVEGPIGGASLREPTEIEKEDAGADLDALPGVDGLGDG